MPFDLGIKNVCMAGWWGLGGGGGEGLGVLVYFRAAEFRPRSALFFYIGRVMCVGDPVFGSLGSGNIISV